MGHPAEWGELTVAPDFFGRPADVTSTGIAFSKEAAYRYAAGVQYDWSKDLSVGVAYTLIDAGTSKVNRSGGPLKGDLQGEYDTNFIHAFNLNVVYRF